MQFELSKPISIGSDHAGYEFKQFIADFLRSEGFVVRDNGTHSKDSVDYPDFAHPVAEQVESGEAAYGILICGSANGVAMTANKHAGIRAAICWNEELASLARAHNDANILCIPARFVSQEIAVQMVKVFQSSPFEGGRHQSRVSKISSC
ncbi:MAG: ribose 5-phosphate isomerase B [Bacteroidetes bacterium]|nr:ribose 5-phosphate isomerase B [Bacteroidota bacterium]